MLIKNQAKYYYDTQMHIRLTTCITNINNELTKINSLFKLFKQNESHEKVLKIQERRKYMNNKCKKMIDELKYELLKCNKRLKYNKSRF